MTSRSQSPEQNEKIEKAEKLFSENISFAYWLIHRYFPAISDDEDVKQEALIGLWKACLAFDGGRDVRFTAFATPCICNNVRMLLRRRAKVNSVLLVPLEQVITDSEELTLADCIEDPASTIEGSGVSLRDVLDRLSDKERRILGCHLLGLTQKEAGKHLGISQSYYCRRLNAIKRKLVSDGGILS